MSRRNGRFAFCKQDGDVQDAVAALLAVGGQAPAPVAAPAPIPAPALSPSVRAVEILTACVEELRQSKGEPRRRKGPQPPSASEFEVGFADAPTDHVAPLPTQGGGAPGADAFPPLNRAAAACVVLGPGDAAPRLVFVYSKGPSTLPISVYYQRPAALPLDHGGGCTQLWRSVCMSTELVDYAREALVAPADFEVVPDGDAGPGGPAAAAGAGGGAPPHHLLVHRDHLTAVAKVLLQGCLRPWRVCEGSTCDSAGPCSSVRVVGRGNDDLDAWVERVPGDDRAVAYATRCPYALWGGKSKRCPRCERLNEVMRKRHTKALAQAVAVEGAGGAVEAPVTPPKAPKGAGYGAMEDSASDRGSECSEDDDEAGSSDVDSDTEEALVCPLERIVRDNLASKTLDLRKTEVMQFVRNRRASLSAVGA